MSTTQLRRYEVEPGKLADLVVWFPNLFPAREAYGFTVDFIYADHATSQLTWSTTHAGDQAAFEAAQAIYHDSPERKTAFESYEESIVKIHAEFVEVAVAPGS